MPFITAAEYDEISGSDHDSMLRAGVISVGVQSAERARYCNVVGYDETRVEVSTGEWQNANHVRVRGLTSRPTKADDLRAIISQGPMHPDYHGPGEQFGRRRRRRPRTRPHQLREALREPRTRTLLITADRRAFAGGGSGGGGGGGGRLRRVDGDGHAIAHSVVGVVHVQLGQPFGVHLHSSAPTGQGKGGKGLLV